MLPTITAGDVMQSSLITLAPEMDVLDAIDLLLRHRRAEAPVVDRDDQFVGNFSEQSWMRLIMQSAVDRLHKSTLPLIEFVDANVAVIDVQADLRSIAQRFIDGACRRLPVLDKHGRLCGEVSRYDLLKAYRDHLRSLHPIPIGAAVCLGAVLKGGHGFG